MARERDIGALLEHPNIARLYDAGVDGKGRPYLALEYIDGRPLDVWCEAQALNTRDRLRLFVQVARAVAYAHGRLVVHRDLKPSNVLVTADGQAHLLDFGIAKLLYEAGTVEDGLTQEQGRVMTPHYAPPEQIKGETITVASDVYSLGVLLFELLTGRYPHQPEGKSVAAIEAAVLSGEAPLASSRAPDKLTARTLQDAIDAILAKALKRDPGQRYTTADAFAEDVDRYLRGDAVQARPDTFAQRFGRALRRHRIEAGAAGAVLLAVLGGAGASLLQARRANEEAERARVVKEFVVDVFKVNGQGNPANSELRRLPVELLLERGASLIEAKFPEQPQLQAELFGVVGGIFADMGAWHAAGQYAMRQVEKLTQMHASDLEQVRGRMLLTRALVGQGRLTDAKVQLHQALQLSTPFPDLHAQAQVLNAGVLFSLGECDSARAEFEEFDKTRWSPGDPTATHARAVSLRAELLSRADRLDDALPLFRTAIAEGLAAEGAQLPAAIDIRLVAARDLIWYHRVKQPKEFSDAALSALHATARLARYEPHWKRPGSPEASIG